ncbi:MAG: helix-turn-helix transcriptional regulator, partial [Candidatus Acidiferrales bacterium]
EEEKVKVAQPDFGIRIKSLRRDNDLSQRDLADSIGRTEEFINKIERGKSFVSKTTLERLAEAFKVSIASLLDFTGNKAFIKSGGLKWRASRKRPALIVRHKKVHIRIPKREE